MTQTLQNKFETLEDLLNSEIFERTQEIHTAIIALLGRKHHFQIGPPGTAKSLLIDRLTKRISSLGTDGYFRWLLTNYTTPEELFGGPDFNLLRDKGIYKRVTTNKAPRAYFYFADEVFKANSSILNSNLTLMNERLFFNADDDPLAPLISMYAASNEMPEGDALWAMWDRLHFRHEIKPMQESGSFIKMLSQPMNPTPEPVIDMADIFAAHAAVDAVKVPAEIVETLKGLRSELKDDGIEVTERRWVECMGIIRAEAFFNGRDIADVEDMRPLMHVLWSNLDHQTIIKKKILELANPIDRDAYETLERLLTLEHDLKEAVADADGPKSVAKQAIEIHGKMEKAKATLLELRKQQKASGRKSEYLATAEQKYKQLGLALMKDGFNIDKDEFTKS